MYQGINIPLVNPSLQLEPVGGLQSIYSQSYPDNIVYPFDIKKGLLKRDYLSLDSYLSQLESVFTSKRDNAAIVNKINNLLTYYDDNASSDYATAISFHQNRIAYLNQSLTTLSTYRSQIATTLTEIDNLDPEDFGDNPYFSNMNGSLTHNQGLSIFMRTGYLEVLDNTFSNSGFNPIGTEGAW